MNLKSNELLRAARVFLSFIVLAGIYACSNPEEIGANDNEAQAPLQSGLSGELPSSGPGIVESGSLQSTEVGPTYTDQNTHELALSAGDVVVLYDMKGYTIKLGDGDLWLGTQAVVGGDLVNKPLKNCLFGKVGDTGDYVSRTAPFNLDAKGQPFETVFFASGGDAECVTDLKIKVKGDKIFIPTIPELPEDQVYVARVTPGYTNELEKWLGYAVDEPGKNSVFNSKLLTNYIELKPSK